MLFSLKINYLLLDLIRVFPIKYPNFNFDNDSTTFVEKYKISYFRNDENNTVFFNNNSKLSQ